MSEADKRFIANVQAATAMLAETEERLLWLNSFAPAAIIDPTTPAEMIDNIDRVLATCRRTILAVDDVVGLVQQLYFHQRSRPPGVYRFN